MKWGRGNGALDHEHDEARRAEREGVIAGTLKTRAYPGDESVRSDAGLCARLDRQVPGAETEAS